jgi:septal ring-binding cell division protein DamX
VVNVLSTTSKKGKIVKDAVKLIKNGYPAYITSARVKGKEWVRLRVGFYKNRNDALKAGKKMQAMLNLDDSWAANIKKAELDEFGSY